MSVSKIRLNNNNEAILTVDSYDKIDKNEFKKFMDLDSPSFLKCEFANDEIFTLLYSYEKYTSLKGFLTQTVTKSNALDFLRSLVRVYIEAEKHTMNAKHILLGVDSVFVNLETYEVAGIYVPVIDGILPERPLRLFIKELLVNMLYSEEDNMTWLGELIRYMNLNRQLDVHAFYSYLETLYDHYADTSEVTFEEPVIEATPIVREISSNDIEDAFANKETVNNTVEEEDEFHKLKAALNMTSIRFGDKDVVDVESVSEATPETDSVEFADEVEEEAKVEYYLYRRSDHSKFSLCKEEIHIGKALDNDISIQNNPVISRLHAVITYHNDEYKIRDNSSTNHTFVNGMMLKPNQEKVLCENDRIVFGNEEFVFKMK